MASSLDSAWCWRKVVSTAPSMMPLNEVVRCVFDGLNWNLVDLFLADYLPEKRSASVDHRSAKSQKRANCTKSFSRCRNG